jgi:hypothetical protein
MAPRSYYPYRQASGISKVVLVALVGAVAVGLTSPAARDLGLAKPVAQVPLEVAAIGLAALIGALKVGTA